MNHKWKDNVCVNCGIYRTRQSWKLLMAIEGGKNYYKYGRSWFYAMPHKDNNVLAKAIGFDRPECKNSFHRLLTEKNKAC